MKKPRIETGPARLIELKGLAAADQQGWELPPPVPLVGSDVSTWGRLREKSVLVVGCGSVGGPVADGFARAGIGGLTLVDPKRYKPASLATHSVSRAAIGRCKALTVGIACKDANRSSRVSVFAGPLQELELAAMAAIDLVVMAPDNLPAEMEAAQRCLWLGVPLIQASVHGPTLTAQVRFFRNADTAGACPACGYGRAEREMLNRQTRFSCEGAAETGVAAVSAPRTNSLQALCATAASLAVICGIRFLLPIGKPLTDSLIHYCGFTQQTVVSPLSHSAACPLDHSRFERITNDGPLAKLSLAQLTREATGLPAAPGTRFRVGRAQWIEMAACSCPQPQVVRRFVSPGSRARKCERCGSVLTPLSFYSYERPNASILGSALDQPLARLGLNGVASVVIRTNDQAVFVQPATPQRT